MFQTLVDVNTRIPIIWGEILGDKYSKEKAYKYGTELQKVFGKMFNKESKSSNFITIRSMFIKSFKDIVNEFGLKLDPEESADIFIREHGFSEPYPYTKKFFEKVKDYIICLISDADFDMINPLLKKFNFDRIYISEQIKKIQNKCWYNKFQ